MCPLCPGGLRCHSFCACRACVVTAVFGGVAIRIVCLFSLPRCLPLFPFRVCQLRFRFICRCACEFLLPFPPDRLPRRSWTLYHRELPASYIRYPLALPWYVLIWSVLRARFAAGSGRAAVPGLMRHYRCRLSSLLPHFRRAPLSDCLRSCAPVCDKGVTAFPEAHDRAPRRSRCRIPGALPVALSHIVGVPFSPVPVPFLSFCRSCSPDCRHAFWGLRLLTVPSPAYPNHHTPDGWVVGATV